MAHPWKTEFEIDGRMIGAGHPAYLIAELSANHNQDYDEAVRLVHAAHEAGADAIKLQTYTADTLTIESDQPQFKITGTPWDGRTLHDLYQEAMTPWDWQPKLRELALGLGMGCFSSPFDATAVAFLEDAGFPAYKIASFEIVDIPLIRQAAATGKPIIISTGMATLDEITEAVDAVAGAGGDALALLKCTSAYPAPASEMNLSCIPDLAARFGLPVGLSDHTMTAESALAAVALGACIIEKHLTLSRDNPGPDSAFSLEPPEFKAMVDSVRTVEAAMGTPGYAPGEAEKKSTAFRRSLFIVEDVAEGEPLTAENVRSIRPGGGLHTRHLDEVMGRKAKAPIKRGTPLSLDLLED